MGFHTFDSDRADKLEDPSRFAYCSVDELLALFGATDAQVVADVGSGTGFYTDEIAPYVAHVYAVDVQDEMHDLYREKGLPANVDPVTAEASDLPFDDGALDAIASTFTYHEFASDAALAELARVLGSGGRVGIADWSAEGRGESGPPTTERFAATDAERAFRDAGFTVTRSEERRETFVLSARLD
jgi:ubiquinone/menaquinone biosynthesis C-methylase UbiE